MKWLCWFKHHYKDHMILGATKIETKSRASWFCVKNIFQYSRYTYQYECCRCGKLKKMRGFWDRRG